MEKPAKFRNKILAFLPKAASFSFHNPPFSPGRDKRSENLNKYKTTHIGKGFSGPIISIIPAEARRKSRIGSFDERVQEPTSPKVSCIGQIKHKKIHPPRKEKKPKPIPKLQKPKRSSSIRNIFHHNGANSGRKSEKKPPMIPDGVPSLGQMKMFSSRRDAFANFDWKANGATVESDHRNYYSDEEIGDSDEEDHVFVPHSAPLMMGGGGGVGVILEPRKEVNLWKRRTMTPPCPLQLNGMHKQP